MSDDESLVQAYHYIFTVTKLRTIPMVVLVTSQVCICVPCLTYCLCVIPFHYTRYQIVLNLDFLTNNQKVQPVIDEAQSVVTFCLVRECSCPAYRECLMEHNPAASSQRYEKAKSSLMGYK